MSQQNETATSSLSSHQTPRAEKTGNAGRSSRKQAKEQSPWNMRGKFRDMQEQLKAAQSKLNDLMESRKEMEALLDTRDSEIQNNLQREIELKAEIQSMERLHSQELENISSKQRIHRQELQDKSIIHKRHITNIEIDVEDLRRKVEVQQKKLDVKVAENDILRDTISQTTKAFTEVQKELEVLKKRQKENDFSMADLDKAIEEKTRHLQKIQSQVNVLRGKLRKEEIARNRLQGIIQELERSRRKHPLLP
ncbi:uncharacterized protein BYT42DRAFT_615860 [Radiomyces spectabilis]|uniref:uncharacterized protein n=1 Tax=Radiomyces spectabilis TaxID=64574 RepID=UPI00221E7042|nr:uncharacterized protein BYT42DRAFT_615860 [Radiomyces spectabilis]KAI8374729.1 hypothetical protein BYT42DRAFT_615860 [Radiomyces spectabilis]